jgi:hypothetical protein
MNPAGVRVRVALGDGSTDGTAERLSRGACGPRGIGSHADSHADTAEPGSLAGGTGL